MTLITAGVEAGADAMARTIGKARRRRAMDTAEPLTGNAPGAPREVTGRAIIGFVIEERVIAADDPLRVVGAARTELGDLVLGKSGLRPLIISRTVPVSSPED